jgi:hypothetical protein
LDIEAAKNLAVLNGNISASLESLKANQALTQQTQQQVAALMSEYAKGQQAINENPNMDQQSKNAASLQNYNNLKAALDLISAVGKVNNVGTLLKPTGQALTQTKPDPKNPLNYPAGHAYDEGRNDPNYLNNRKILLDGIKKYKPNFYSRTDTMSNSEITNMLTNANYT